MTRQLNGKVIVFDCDGVIARNNNGNYKNAFAYKHAIEQINKAYDEGYYIRIATARYMDREKGNISKVYQRGFEEWKDWLADNGVKYDELFMGKASGDLYVDDKALRVESEKGMEDWDSFWVRLEELKNVDKYNQPLNRELDAQGELVKEFT